MKLSPAPVVSTRSTLRIPVLADSFPSVAKLPRDPQVTTASRAPLARRPRAASFAASKPAFEDAKATSSPSTPKSSGRAFTETSCDRSRALPLSAFLGVQMLPVATCCSYVVLIVLLPLRFIGIESRSEFDAGVLLLALSAPMLVIPTIAATLTRWTSAGASRLRAC